MALLANAAAFTAGLHHVAATGAALYLLTAAATARWLPAHTEHPGRS
ncbi:hypothetical protein [Streptomyces sp. NPDC059918]